LCQVLLPVYEDRVAGSGQVVQSLRCRDPGGRADGLGRQVDGAGVDRGTVAEVDNTLLDADRDRARDEPVFGVGCGSSEVTAREGI
jgi:hypothetical protein